MRIILILLVINGFGPPIIGQINFQNPSFEDEPQDATTPTDWLACDELTTPDILPGYWSVYNRPADGDTYVGLISRPDGTWETIGQRLPETLAISPCYNFFVWLAHSKTYEGYNNPVKLRIWGGLNRCDKDQLLYESPLINHKKWKRYQIDFILKKEINYIIFEVFINKDYKFNTMGNILLDHLSPIRICPRA